MFGRRTKTGVVVAAFLVLAVEGVFLYHYYDRYYWSDAPSAAEAVSGSAPASEGTVPEVTTPEGTTPKGSSEEGSAAEGSAASGAAPVDASGAVFVHRATDENSRGDYTYLDHPLINGDPEAVVLAVQAPDRGDAREDAYEHNIGVWYEPQRQKWAIFNQDRAPVPAGSAFEVTVPPEPERFLHRSTEENTSGDSTYLDDPLVNGRPGAEVSVTQNWNPGGGGGVYNDHPVGTRYDAGRGRWAVYNTDGAPVKQGAAFNVGVS